MDYFDGIIKFKHDKAWAIKKAKKHIPKKFISDDNNLNNWKIEKMYCPFFKCAVKGNAHVFWTGIINTRHNIRFTTYNENEHEVDSEIVIGGNKSIKKPYGSYYRFEKNKNYRDMIDFDLDGATFMEFMETDESFMHCKDFLYRDSDTELKNYEILEFLRNPNDSFFITNTSVINYDITDIKRYYYPIWIITSDNLKKTYYIDDVYGKINGNDEIFDIALYTTVALEVVILLVLIALLIIGKFYTVNINLYLIVMGLPILGILISLYVAGIIQLYFHYLYKDSVKIKTGFFNLNQFGSDKEYYEAIEAYLKKKFGDRES